MLEKGMNSYWFCNFPLSEEHKKAELAPIEQYHNLDMGSCYVCQDKIPLITSRAGIQ
jgi:hypothetical protein